MGETLITCDRVRQPPSSWIWRDPHDQLEDGCGPALLVALKVALSQTKPRQNQR